MDILWWEALNTKISNDDIVHFLKISYFQVSIL